MLTEPSQIACHRALEENIKIGIGGIGFEGVDGIRFRFHYSEFLGQVKKCSARSESLHSALTCSLICLGFLGQAGWNKCQGLPFMRFRFPVVFVILLCEGFIDDSHMRFCRE